MGEKYESVDKMVEKLCSKKDWLLWDHIEAFFWNIYKFINPVPKLKELKGFFQRGKNGYSKTDFWDLGHYLSEIIPPMIKQLKDSDFRGLPNGLMCKYYKKRGYDYYNTNDITEEEQNSIEEAVNKEYDKILGEIIWSFELAEKIWRDDCMNYIEDHPNKDLLKNKYKMISKHEHERMKIGFSYFTEYFFDLWD